MCGIRQIDFNRNFSNGATIAKAFSEVCAVGTFFKFFAGIGHRRE